MRSKSNRHARRPSLGLGLGAGLLVASLAACGDDAPPAGPDASTEACTTPLAMRYQPLVVGATWTYAISEPDTMPREKTGTIEEFEDVGDRKAGVMAFRQRSEKLDGFTVAWFEDRCTSVVRHREKSYDMADVLVSDQFYMPDKLRVDETPAHLTTGARWTSSFTELEIDPTGMQTLVSKDENWSVVSASESVTVPAGTFPNALHLHKLTSGAAEKDYWFVPGVGKVKETGEQTEELTAYTIP